MFDFLKIVLSLAQNSLSLRFESAKLADFSHFCKFSQLRAVCHINHHISSVKVFYRYNPATEQYERVYPDRRRRIAAAIRPYVWAIAVVAVIGVALYSFVETPREKMLRQSNERLQARVDLLGRRADEAIAVMEDLAERDNNFYRAMMQAEPLSAARRYAGLERQRIFDRLDSLPDDELVSLVRDKLDRLDQMVYTQVKSYDYLASQVDSNKARTAHMPAIQPVPGKYLARRLCHPRRQRAHSLVAERIRQYGRNRPRLQLRHALRPPVETHSPSRPAGEARRPYRACRQYRQIDRAAPALRGALPWRASKPSQLLFL